MRTVLATLIAYSPLVLTLIMTSGTADWSGMWQYYLFAAAAPIVVALER